MLMSLMSASDAFKYILNVTLVLISGFMLLQRAGQAKYVPNGRVREMNKGTGASSAPPSDSVGPEESEMLSSRLAAASPDQQKQMLGECLYPLVSQHNSEVIHYTKSYIK